VNDYWVPVRGQSYVHLDAVCAKVQSDSESSQRVFWCETGSPAMRNDERISRLRDWLTGLERTH
jgi:hypothetical protein